MQWVFEHPDRLLEERAAIARLAGEVDWIQATRWGFTRDALLKVDVDLVIGDGLYDVELVYPNLFPDTPAYVRPRSSTERWSSHQYGPGGVLCLEWGSDNWVPEITGAELLRSAHRLLSVERGTDGTAARVPSRHQLTYGQEIRSSRRRFVLTPALANFVGSIAPQTRHGLVTRSLFHDSAIVLFVPEIVPAINEVFVLPDLPLGIRTYGPLFSWEGHGWLFKSDAFRDSGDLTSAEALLAMLHSGGFADFTLAGADGDKPANSEQLFLLASGERVIHALAVETSGERVVREYTILQPGHGEEKRLPAEHLSLREKRVGIVGLGSVGSKVAVSLARSGVRKFLLIDDDVLLDANVCRHELDWASVGVNKVDAVKEALLLVAPGIEVRTRQTRVAGQESPQSASTALEALGACDLLIDATASPSAFVQIAAVARRRARPLIWGEVFAGGIGALFARSRPTLDPAPLALRAAIHHHLQTLPPAPFAGAAGYDAEWNGAPVVAFDAEVSQLAAVLTSFAIDTLLDRAVSEFPCQAYLIGFKRGWIFEAPFDTHPIFVQAPVAEIPDSPGARDEALVVLGDLLDQQINNADTGGSR